MTRSLDKFVVQDFRNRPAKEVLNASPDVLLGVSASDAKHLDQAFSIRTVRDLAESRFFRQAQAVVAAASEPGFDPGPPPDWETFFAAAPLAHYEQHLALRFRLDFGPVYYRGRLDDTARVIVMGQDPSTNELLAHRVFMGRSGQRIQGFLAKLGLTRSYTLFNTFLFSVFGQFDAELRAISLEAPILNYRNAFLDRLTADNPVQAVIAVGNAAKHAVEHWPGSSALHVFEITHPAARDEANLLANWNTALVGLRTVVTSDDDGQVDPVDYGQTFQDADHKAIPTCDLPFGVPAWQGANGGHSDRNGNKQIVWTAP